MRLCLSGFGNVGRHFVRLLAERRAEIGRRYGIALELTAMASSAGSILSPGPLDLERLLGLGRDPGWAAGYPRYGRADVSGAAVIAAAAADILVEATPSDLRTGEPAPPRRCGLRQIPWAT